MSEVPKTDQDAFHVFGKSCLGGQILILSKAIMAHDVFMASAALISATAQYYNGTKGEAVRNRTIPALTVGCCLFALGGFQNHNRLLLEFGLAKLVGTGLAFCFDQFAAWLQKKSQALGFLTNHLLLPKILGAIILDYAAIRLLGLDGLHQFRLGHMTHDYWMMTMGALSMAGASGLVFGQTYAAIKATEQSVMDGSLHDPITDTEPSPS